MEEKVVNLILDSKFMGLHIRVFRILYIKI